MPFGITVTYCEKLEVVLEHNSWATKTAYNQNMLTRLMIN